MKTIQLLTFVLLTNFLFGQDKQFFYEYRHLPDSVNREKIESEIMALNVNKLKSEFYSVDKYISDSTLLADSNKGVFSMPPNKVMNNDRIIKPANSKSIEYITILSDTKYFVSQKIDLKWDIIPEFESILGYKAQKATTEFGGRKWIAWFSEEIPIQDGPYKFCGLPGLIVKIEDMGKNHIYELKGIKNSETDFEYPELNNFRIMKVNYPKYVKVYKKYRKNPMADQIGMFPDQTDSNGVFRTGAEIFRANEKIVLERLSKDNNIIEIDLLKK